MIRLCTVYGVRESNIMKRMKHGNNITMICVDIYKLYSLH